MTGELVPGRSVTDHTSELRPPARDARAHGTRWDREHFADLFVVELAHVALGVMGEGEVTVHGRRQPAAEAFAAAGLAPVAFEGREALALINGTSCETAQAALLVLGAK